MIGCPALSPKELKLALKNLSGRHALRNRALVILGVRCGLRISELLALKVDQVWQGGSATPPLAGADARIKIIDPEWRAELDVFLR